MIHWERTTNCVNAGGWRVYDDRLDRLSTLYLGYTKREAQRAHAERVRSLKCRSVAWKG